MVANASFSIKKYKISKFAPKVDEGFMLGYGSNVYAYRVFNKTSWCIEIARDVTFDESNGSQEHFDPSFVENKESPCNAIKKLAIGEVKPQERKEQEEEDGIKLPSAIPAHSLEVPEKWPKVPDKCSEVSDIPENYVKSKLKIKSFEMLVQFLSRELMMIKMKTMKINCMKKKTKLQFNDNNSFHTQECTKAFNGIIRSTTS